ncbi:uncharacterized protein LOC144467570 [Augochlora pura]
MILLRWIFMLITLCGCWRPASWDPIPWRYLYNVYTAICFIMVHLAFFGGVLDLVLIVDNQNDLSENLYKTTAFAVHCYKLATLLAMRQSMGVIMDTLDSHPFAPVGTEELEIRTKFDKSVEKMVKVYTTVLESWTVWTVLVSLLMNFTSRKLLYRVWLPFEYTSATIYSLVYLHHALVTVVCVTLSAAYDSLFAGLLVHIYSQFEILRHRLQNVHRNENDLVKRCAYHHDQIYKFANMVNNEFKSVTFMQFLESAAVLCFSLYQLTLSELDGSLADVALYVACTLLQILYFCWFGNEVKLKSLEVPAMIFETEWTSLSNKTKKILLMMMNRATVPIEFTSFHIVIVNLETFKTLVKTSYSVFNLLQQNYTQRIVYSQFSPANKPKMKVLRLIFKLITLCGCWRPASWNSTPWRHLYNMYAMFFYLVLQLAFFGGALDLALTVDNRNDLSENLYKTMAFGVDCYKLASMLSMRESIGILMDILESEPFAPVGDEEMEIRTKFDKSAEKIVKVYLSALVVWFVWTVLGTLLMDFASRKLLYRVWLPFECTSAIVYSFVYLHHALATLCCVTAAVAYDGLFAGLLVHIYSQFEILRYRLQNVHRSDIYSVKHCTYHHDEIYKFAYMVNDEFKTVTFLQFFKSTVVLCFSLYQLVMSELDGKLADVGLYVCCTVLQVFYYCWFGNEVKLKSLEVTDMIFESGWTSLSNKAKKILLVMMRRATEPIELSSLHIITVNLETFKAMLKMSYSIFSLLR